MKPIKSIKIFLCSVLSLFMGYMCLWLWEHNYVSALQAIALHSTPFRARLSELLSRPHLPAYYLCLRIIASISLLLLSARFFRYLNKGSYVVYSGENKIPAGIYHVLTDNRKFLSRLSRWQKYSLVLFLVAAAASYFYMASLLPFSCDESDSCTFFSAVGFWESATYYLIPNNHVFFNELSSLLQHLPIDLQLSTRLPSILATLVACYYFFKIMYKCFPPGLAFIAAAGFAFCYPVAYYASAARGYALVNLFCVLSVYSLLCIAADEKPDKHLTLYVLWASLGFYSIPTFLYCFVPISLAMLLYAFRNRRLLWPYIKAHVAISAVTYLLYLPVIFLSGSDVLTNNAVIKKRTYGYLKENIAGHLREVWHYLLGVDVSIYSSLLLFAGLVVALRRRGNIQAIALLALCMLLSPIGFIFVMRVIPYVRVWSWLAIPLAIACGICLNFFTGFIKLKKPGILVPVMLLCMAVAGTANIIRLRHKPDDELRVDYVGRDYGKTLHRQLSKVRKIEYTYAGISFIAAGYLKFDAHRANRDRISEVRVISQGENPSGDILILDTGNVCHFPLINYDLVQGNRDYFKVYVRKDL